MAGKSKTEKLKYIIKFSLFLAMEKSAVFEFQPIMHLSVEKVDNA